MYVVDKEMQKFPAQNLRSKTYGNIEATTVSESECWTISDFVNYLN